MAEILQYMFSHVYVVHYSKCSKLISPRYFPSSNLQCLFNTFYFPPYNTLILDKIPQGLNSNGFSIRRSRSTENSGGAKALPEAALLNYGHLKAALFGRQAEHELYI